MTSHNLFFIADLHLGHKKIDEFAREHRQKEPGIDHDEWVIDRWNSVVRKKDTVIILGDLAFTSEGLDKVYKLRGFKKLVPGNHDRMPMSSYSNRGIKVLPGLLKYKGVWLSHAPIHPESLRDLPNVHGHLHHHVLEDPRYLNVSVEQSMGIPVSLEEVQERLKDYL